MSDSYQGHDAGKRGAGGESKPKETLRSIDEHFQRAGRLYSTRTADAYLATERATQEQVCLWVLRHPLAPSSDAAERFVKRLDLISRLTTAVARLRFYGVDTQGTAFLVTDYTDGTPLVDVRASFPVLQDHFMEALRKVALLHQRGIVLGDICESSFIVDVEANRTHLLPVLGTFEVEAHQTALLPPPNTLHYVAPEQRSGAGVEIGSDVYALGVLGYRLFTGRYLFGDKPPLLGAEEQLRLAPAPTAINARIGIWVDDVIGKCIQTQPTERYRDADEILQTIERSIKTGTPPGGNGRWSQRTVVVHPTVANAVKATRSKHQDLDRREREAAQLVPEPRTASVSKGVMFFAVSMLVCVLVAGGLFLGYQAFMEEDGRISRDFPIRPEDVPAELLPYFTEFYSERLPLENREAALRKIAASDDPIAYAVLASAVKQTANPALRRIAQDVLVERLRAKHQLRTADFLTKWFQSGEADKPSNKEPTLPTLVLRACDQQIPNDQRKNAVQKIYAEQPMLAMQLAASLAIDSRPDERFLALLRQIMVARVGQQELRDKGIGALLLADRALSLLFEKDIAELLPEFSVADLAWGLNRLADLDSPILNDVALELMNRKSLPPFQAVFLERLTAEDRFTLPPTARKALVHGASAEISYADIVAIGRWGSPSSEPVLFAMCALARDSETQLSAFDTLSNLELRTQPGKSLVEWVRLNFWDYRGRAVKSIGILGLVELASREQLEYAFDMLMPFGGGGELLKILAKSNVDKLILMALDRLGQVTSSNDLVPLLTHANPKVRIAAVKGLKGRNDLAILQAVLRAYAEEKDPEVRQAYQDSHWVVSEGGKLQ